ncbi:hypothetical protein [Daejeonella sp.]|uniref:hypothetical protein n=1 Tax=Daejeonella sp. TaxID=2805397 RepID=UPI0030BC11EE
MENTNEKETGLTRFNGKNTSADTIEGQLDNLIALLSKEPLDYMQTSHLEEKINTLTDLLNNENNHSTQLYNIKLETSSAKKYNFAKRVSRIIRMIIAVLLILLGFGMIIMPAPEYFEMFTLFYLNPNDGVTIMDVISLIVAFTGVSLLISAILKFNNGLVK